MAQGDTDIGTGTTVAFPGAWNLVGEILSVAHSGMVRGEVNVSHMGTTTAHIFLPTDLYDPGGLALDMHFDAHMGITTLMTGAKGATTITFPEATVWGFDGFATGYDITDPFEDKMTATVNIKASGEITVT